MDSVCETSKVALPLDAQGNVNVTCDFQGFSVVETFDFGETIGVLFHEIRKSYH